MMNLRDKIVSLGDEEIDIDESQMETYRKNAEQIADIIERNGSSKRDSFN